jgi:hypothetical protein
MVKCPSTSSGTVFDRWVSHVEPGTAFDASMNSATATAFSASSAVKKTENRPSTSSGTVLLEKDLLRQAVRITMRFEDLADVG